MSILSHLLEHQSLSSNLSAAASRLIDHLQPKHLPTWIKIKKERKKERKRRKLHIQNWEQWHSVSEMASESDLAKQ